MKHCKTCKYFIENIKSLAGGAKTYGNCECEKNIKAKEIDPVPDGLVIFYGSLCWLPVVMDDNFGCVHYEEEE